MTEKWLQMKELGNNEFKQQHYNVAADYYTRGIQLNENEAVLYANRGTCMKLLQRYKDSLNDYKKAVQLNPKNTKNIKKLASVQLIVGNFGDAQILLQKCCDLEPSDSSNKSELEKIQKIIQSFDRINEKVKDKNWEDVELLSRQLLSDAPAFPTLQKIYIESCLEVCKLQEGIDYINNKITENTKEKDKEYIFLLAKAYYFKGEYDKAKPIIEKLIKDNSNMQEEKYFDLQKKIETINDAKTKANGLFKEQKYEEAIEEYTKLLEFDPENKNFQSIILTNRALCNKKLTKNMEALKDADEAIKLNPNYPTAYIRRALIYEEFNMFDDAKSDLSKAKELDPNNNKIEGYLNEANQKSDHARKRDYYQILGVGKDAGPDEIKKSYRKLALKYHPDRNSESEQSKKIAQRKFEDVSDAYSVLSDPKKKAMFDQGIDPLNPENGGMGTSMHVDPMEIFSTLFGSGIFGGGSSGGSGGFGNMGGFNIFNMGGGGGPNIRFSTSGFGNDDNDGSDFSSFFGGGIPFGFSQGGQRARRKKK